MYIISETVLPIHNNGRCSFLKPCSDVTLNLSFRQQNQYQIIYFDQIESVKVISMYHTGRQYDGYGRLNNWFDQITADMLNTTTGCMKTQYSNYNVDGIAVNMTLKSTYSRLIVLIISSSETKARGKVNIT